MEQLKEKAIQYREGMLTSREFIGQVTHLLAEHYASIPVDVCDDEMADELASLLIIGR